MTDGEDLLSFSRFASLLGFRLVERSDGEAIVECVIAEDHANTRGTGHGGVVTTLIDTAAGASVAYQPSIGGRPIATVSLSVNFLAPYRVGDVLRARGARTGSGKRIVNCQVQVTNQGGEEVAIGLVTLATLALPQQ